MQIMAVQETFSVLHVYASDQELHFLAIVDAAWASDPAAAHARFSGMPSRCMVTSHQLQIETCSPCVIQATRAGIKFIMMCHDGCNVCFSVNSGSHLLAARKPGPAAARMSSSSSGPRFLDAAAAPASWSGPSSAWSLSPKVSWMAARVCSPCTRRSSSAACTHPRTGQAIRHEAHG